MGDACALTFRLLKLFVDNAEMFWRNAPKPKPPGPTPTNTGKGSEMSNWNWKHSPELMARLAAAQNLPHNWNRDVMTFAGFCGSEEQLRKHVESCEQVAA